MRKQIGFGLAVIVGALVAIGGCKSDTANDAKMEPVSKKGAANCEML